MDWIRALVYNYPILSLIIVFLLGRLSKRSYLFEARNANDRIAELEEELEDANEQISELEDKLTKKDEHNEYDGF